MKNCLEEENYRWTKGCRLAADIQARSKKIYATMYWKVLPRNGYTLQMHGIYIRSVWNLTAHQSYQNLRNWASQDCTKFSGKLRWAFYRRESLKKLHT